MVSTVGELKPGMQALLAPHDETVRTHFVLYVILGSNVVSPEDLSADMRTLVGAFYESLGLNANSERADVGAKLKEYFEAEPVNPELLAGFLALLASAEGSDDRRKGAARLLDNAMASLPPGAAPPGAVKGPLAARLDADKLGKKR